MSRNRVQYFTIGLGSSGESVMCNCALVGFFMRMTLFWSSALKSRIISLLECRFWVLFYLKLNLFFEAYGLFMLCISSQADWFCFRFFFQIILKALWGKFASPAFSIRAKRWTWTPGTLSRTDRRRPRRNVAGSWILCRRRRAIPKASCSELKRLAWHFALFSAMEILHNIFPFSSARSSISWSWSYKTSLGKLLLYQKDNGKFRMILFLAGQLIDWLICSIDRLFVCSIDWLFVGLIVRWIDWLIDWKVIRLIGRLIDWLFGGSIDWLIEWVLFVDF